MVREAAVRVIWRAGDEAALPVPVGVVAVDEAAALAYAARAADLLERQAASVDRFVDLCDAPKPEDATWRSAVLWETLLWQALAREVRALAAPAPLRGVQERLVATYALLERAGVDYRRGVVDGDDERVYAGIARLDAASDLIAEVIERLRAA